MAFTETFGWYGLGSMGLPMAMNLQKHLAASSLPPLHYSNRTLSRGDALRDAGAVQKDKLFSVLVESNILFTMVANDEVLEELISEALQSKSELQGKVWVDCSTVHPDTCQRASSALAERGATFVAAPVFGASPVAADGKLIFSMAGPAATIERLRPFVVDVMGRSIINMGEDVCKSSLLKISGNIFVIGFQELTAEALVFAEKSGLGTSQMEDFIGSMYGSVLQSYSKRMTSGSYAPPLDTPPGFVVALAYKDAGHALALGSKHGARLSVLETARAHMDIARKYAGECLDSSCVYGAARMEAGLPFWNENSRQSN